MGIDPIIFRALVEQGATPEMLLAVVEAAAAADEARRAEKREGNKRRQTEWRERQRNAHTREADPIGVPIAAKLIACRLAAAALSAVFAKRLAEQAPDIVVAAWNAMAARADLRPVRKLTPERRSRLRARLAEHGSDACTEAIAAVERSPFCLGDNDRGWRADFDFLLQPASFNRLLEGSYDRAKPIPSGRAKPNGRSHHPLGRIGAASDRAFGVDG